MDAARQENILKKRLQAFLAEMLKFGTIKGFKNFAMYLRGREELVISVLNEPKSSPYSHTLETKSTAPGFKDPNRSGSLTSNNLPYDKRSLLISMRSQMNLTTAAVPKGVGLPPASPSDSETQPGDEASTLFLIAGYARYSCPYVWIRSNHQRLINLMGDTESEKDSPLRLKTTASWKDTNVSLYDIVSELVKLNTYPAPQNPFELDMEYFSSLPLSEQVLETGAMVQTLKKIFLSTSDDRPYTGYVLEDLQIMTKMHFTALKKLVQEGGLPIAQQEQRHRSGAVSGPGRSRYPSSLYGQAPPSQYGAGYYDSSQQSYSYTGY
ncbi:uncharacterized protein LOC133189114 [Saccostrea echinata]|uniref:uncharacterized protein LOC133189114 n=1 Tax=Saccostrea echinata TaxID=191078 RepID=UPI002A81DE33|nr:uncharacterized protein LOC133189114 [Saccostrea echinata]